MIAKKTLVWTLATLVLLLGTAGIAAAITNGQPDGDNHPYVGLLVFDSVFPDGSIGPAWRCSGALIAPDVVLTAGHCTDGAVAARAWFDEDVAHVLPRRHVLVEPGVIGQIHKHPGSLPDILPGQAGEDVLKTDQGSQGNLLPAGGEPRPFVAGAEAQGHLQGGLEAPVNPAFEGNILAEQHQLALVVFPGKAALGIKEKGAVEILRFPGIQQGGIQ